MSTELRDIDHSYYDAWLGSRSKLGYSKWLADLAEAAEARAAQLQAERDALAAQLATVTAQYNTLKEMYRADHDQRIRQEEQIRQLNSEIKYLRSTDHAADLAFERMAPLDWRDAYGLADETPLGQALDGMGDEVEP